MTLKELLINHEGVRLKPYKDTVGKWTIGVGRNISDVAFSDDEKIYLGIPPRDIFKGITIVEAMYLLDNDIKKAIKDEQEHFDWVGSLDNVRQAVVIDMIFNLGITKFSKFTNTISYIKEGDYEKAADNMLLSLWAKQVGRRAKELSEMMRTGHAPNTI